MTAHADRPSAVGHNSDWAPCALCGFTDTETPPHGYRYGDELPMGTQVTCDDCGATLTLDSCDYCPCEDCGPSWLWVATPPSALPAPRPEHVAAVTAAVDQAHALIGGAS